jgi:putative ABC transport system permease protein
MQTVLQDLLYTLRQLRKSPGFTLLAITVLALGIGANTAVFSVVDAVLLKPLSFHEANRIVTLASLWKKTGRHGQVSAPDFHDWHDQSAAFAAMAYYEPDEIAVTVGNSAEYTHATEVTSEFFTVFQLTPVAGRLFTEDEMKPHSNGAAIVSNAYWQSHFGGSLAALSQQVKMKDHTLNIVGVLPPGMRFPDKTDIWFPANTIHQENTYRSGHNYRVVARLRSGATLDQAQAQMASIGARLEKQYPDSNENKTVAVTPMLEEMVTSVRLTLYLLLGAVGAVLLIACANMANVLLARATIRMREMAIRTAVGASRARIVRQLITESLVLSLAGGAAALVLANWASRILVALAPGDVPRIGESSIDGQVLLFTFGVSLAASFLFGLVPALQLSRVDLYEALKPGSGRTLSSGRSGTMRSALVVAQVALSVLLLTGAGLLIKSFAALHNVSLGYRPENLLIMESDVPVASNFPPSAEELKRLQHATSVYRELLAAVSTMPGVKGVGATRGTPSDVRSTGSYVIDHLGTELTVNAPQAVLSVVTPGAFEAIGMPILRGRDFQDSDTYDAPFTAVINQALARETFAGQDPIGRIIFCGLDSFKGMTIVGVVSDIRQHGPAQEPSPEIYMPYQQHPLASTALNVVVRTASAPGTLEAALQRKMRALSPDSPVRFTTVQAELSQNIAAPKFRTLLLAVFAGLALALAMVGVYGVMSYTVSQSTNEIGVRMALGASRGNVLRLVLSQALTLSIAGLIAGLIGALVLGKLMNSVLFMVKPSDPITLGAVSLLLLAVALAASYIPARRATKVDPLIAMRYE